MSCHLGDDVGRRAEAVEAESLAVSCQAERPVADQPSAEQRCGLEAGVALRHWHAEALVRHRQRRVAAVAVVPRKASPIAKVLATRAAVAALPARPAEPGDPDSGTLLEPLSACDHAPDDLVAQHERELGLGQLAVDDVQVGPAYAAGGNRDEHLTGTGLRIREMCLVEGSPRGVQDHGAHRRLASSHAPGSA